MSLHSHIYVNIDYKHTRIIAFFMLYFLDKKLPTSRNASSSSYLFNNDDSGSEEDEEDEEEEVFN